MKTTTQAIAGTYGSRQTPDTILTARLTEDTSPDAPTWYCVKGSVNVNATHEELSPGLDVETVEDVDTFTAPDPVEDLDTLATHVLDLHFDEISQDYDPANYDLAGARADMENGNFSDWEDYFHPEIILRSVFNGQFTQARAQFAYYSEDAFDAAEEIREHASDTSRAWGTVARALNLDTPATV